MNPTFPPKFGVQLPPQICKRLEKVAFPTETRNAVVKRVLDAGLEAFADMVPNPPRSRSKRGGAK